MKKIPLELFGPKEETEARSPLVWNGIQFELCEEILLSELVSSLKDAKNKYFLTNNLSFSYEQTIYNVGAILNDLNAWHSDAVLVADDLSEVEEKLLARLKSSESDVGVLEGLQNRSGDKIFDYQNVLEKVTSGDFLKNSSKYRVTFLDSKYHIKKEISSIPSLVPNEWISLTTTTDGTRIDYLPYDGLTFLSGNGTYVNDYGYKTYNVGNILRSSKTIEVDPLLNKFLIKPKIFISSKNIDFSVNVLPEKGFRLSVNPRVLYTLNFSFSAGYGIQIENSTIFLTDNFYPVLVEGKGIRLNKDSYKNFTVNFESSDFGYNNFIVSGLYPITSRYSNTRDASGNTVETYSLGMDNKYYNNIQNILLNVTKSLQNSDTRINHLTMDILSEGAKRRLACPLLNLYDLIVNGEITESNAPNDPISNKLIEKLGPSPVNIDLTIDILPIAEVSIPTGPGPFDGATFSFNLFSYLEANLKYRLSDPTFRIYPEDINTRYFISLFDPSSSTIVRKDIDSGEITSAPYNTAWSPDISKVSSTYAGMLLSFTTGDLDFYRGIARNGQDNTIPCRVPSTFESDVNKGIYRLSINSVSKSVDTTRNLITYTMTALDGYLGRTFSLKWTRPINVLDQNTDYMKELAGSDAPEYIRLLGRLYANWQYNTKDLNECILLIKTVSELISNGVIKDFYDYVLDPNYFSSSTDLANANFNVILNKLDRMTGDVTITVDISNVSLGNSYFSLDMLLKSIQIPVRFKVLPMSGGKSGNSSILMSCCWNDLKYVKVLECYSESSGSPGTSVSSTLEDCARILFNDSFGPTNVTTAAPTPAPTPTSTTPKPTTTPRPTTTTTPRPTTTTTPRPTTTTTPRPTTTTTPRPLYVDTNYFVGDGYV